MSDLRLEARRLVAFSVDAFLEEPTPHNTRALAAAINDYYAGQDRTNPIPEIASRFENVPRSQPTQPVDRWHGRWPLPFLVDTQGWSNGILGYGADPIDVTHVKGDVFELAPMFLPIGVEIHSITSIAEDDANFDLLDFWFGTYNLAHPYNRADLRVPWPGADDHVNLSSFSEYVGRVAPYALARTKVDIAVRARLRCRTDGAQFHGFNIAHFCEEAVCHMQPHLKGTPRVLEGS